MLRKTPLKSKKLYTLKKSPLKVMTSLSMSNQKKQELRNTITPELAEDVLELFKQNESPIIIAKKLNCTLDIVKMILKAKKENNIEIFKKISENLEDYLQKRDWKSVRQYALVLFSKVVKAKARFKCEMCGKPGTDAHHWYYTKAHNGITDIMSINGICVCRNCHIKVHKQMIEYREKIQHLNRYKDAAAILEPLVDLPIDFDYVKKIILENKQVLRDIYTKNKIEKDVIVEELLRLNIKEK